MQVCDSFSTFFVPDLMALVLAETVSYGTMAVELFLMLCLIAAVFLFKARILKIIAGCAAEFCLWQACKAAFGPDAIPTQILTWITAVVVIVLTLAIVNRIPWHQYGSKKDGQDR